MTEERKVLIKILRALPEGGKRLPKGLAVRVSKGNGMFVCGCSRVGVAPSVHEVRVIIECMAEIHNTDNFFMPAEPKMREIPRYIPEEETAVIDEHYIWRFYWPEEEILPYRTVCEAPRQEALI